LDIVRHAARKNDHHDVYRLHCTTSGWTRFNSNDGTNELDSRCTIPLLKKQPDTGRFPKSNIRLCKDEVMGDNLLHAARKLLRPKNASFGARLIFISLFIRLMLDTSETPASNFLTITRYNLFLDWFWCIL
jgi:hypothetical protein